MLIKHGLAGTGFVGGGGGGGGVTVSGAQLGFTSSVTSTPEVTVDLSAYGSGDRVVVFYQTDDTQTTAARYNGSEVAGATNHIQQTVGNTRGAAWSFELTSAGGVSDTVGVTISAGRSQHRFGIAVIESGSVTGTDEDLKQITTADLTTSVTVANSANAIIAWAVANSQNGAFGTWSGATEQASDQQPASGHYFEIATASNVSTGTHNVSVPVATGDETAASRSLLTLLVE